MDDGWCRVRKIRKWESDACDGTPVTSAGEDPSPVLCKRPLSEFALLYTAFPPEDPLNRYVP